MEPRGNWISRVLGVFWSGLGFLGFWVFVLLGFWAFGLLGFLGFWDFGFSGLFVFGCWGFGFCVFLRVCGLWFRVEGFGVLGFGVLGFAI